MSGPAAAVCAATACALACAVLVRPGPAARLDRLRGADVRRPPDLPLRDRLLRVVPLSVVGCVAVLATAGPAVLLLALAGLVAAVTAVVLLRRGRRRRAATGRRAEVAELCDALVAGLSAGAPPGAALTDLARDWPFLEPVALTARLGGRVPAAWRAVATEPGAGDLAQVAAAWELSGRTGSPLAATVERIAASLRDGDEARQEVEASLGPPRATARLLAILPVLGLGLGAGLGGNPLVAMTTSAPVAGCVLVGTCLAAVGVVWVERVADAAAV